MVTRKYFLGNRADQKRALPSFKSYLSPETHSALVAVVLVVPIIVVAVRIGRVEVPVVRVVDVVRMLLTRPVVVADKGEF